MKLITFIAAVLMSTSMVFAKEKPKVKEVTYSCEIDCHSCKDKIMKNIPYEKGVKKVVVDMDKKKVTVAFREDKNTTEEIEKAIEKLGYAAEVDRNEVK
jgi:copper chaperone CopZ